VLRQNNTSGDHTMAFIKYHHLTYEDRCQIYALNRSGLTQCAIATQLSVHPSTVGRELKRNKGKRGYRYKQAQDLASSRKKRASSSPHKMTNKLVSTIEKKLCEYQWSPEQISGWLKRNMKTSVSHERIYQHIWNDKRDGGALYKHLRHNGKKYNKRKGKSAGRGLIPNRVDIDKRPTIVEKKSRVGDWEIDTIIGKSHIGVLVSMVDRASKYTKLVLIENKKAHTVTGEIKKAMTLLEASFEVS